MIGETSSPNDRDDLETAGAGLSAPGLRNSLMNDQAPESSDDEDVVPPEHYPPLNRALFYELFITREVSISAHCMGYRWMLCCGFGADMSHVKLCSSYFVHYGFLWFTRVVSCLWALGILFSHATTLFRKPYLTSLTYCMTCLYLTVVAISSTVYCLHRILGLKPKMDRLKHKNNLYKYSLRTFRVFTTVLFEINVTMVLIVDGFYWGVLYWQDFESVSVFGLHAHLLNALWIGVELLSNKIPIYLLNFLGIWAYGFFYLIIQVSYWARTGDPIYSVMDWSHVGVALPIFIGLMIGSASIHSIAWILVKARDITGIAFNRWRFEIAQRKEMERHSEAIQEHSRRVSEEPGLPTRGSREVSGGGRDEERPDEREAPEKIVERVDRARDSITHSEDGLRNSIGSLGLDPDDQDMRRRLSATPKTPRVGEENVSTSLATDSFMSARSYLTAVGSMDPSGPLSSSVPSQWGNHRHSANS